MPERRAGTDADQACDLGDLQSQVAPEQEVTGDPHTGIIALALLEELKGGLQNVFLLIAQPFRRDLCRATTTFPVGRQLEIPDSDVGRGVLSDNWNSRVLVYQS